MGNLEHVKLDRDMRIAIVLGSSKADGNTHQFAEAVAAVSGGACLTCQIMTSHITTTNIRTNPMIFLS